MEIILKIIGLFVAFVLVVIAFKIALFLIGAYSGRVIVLDIRCILAWFHDRWQHRCCFRNYRAIQQPNNYFTK